MTVELISEVKAIRNVDAKTQVEMYELFRRCFKAIEWQVFYDDLMAKDWLIMMRDPNGLLHGFSSLQVYDVAHRQEQITIVYSGDTIVAPEAWGSFQPLRTFLQTAFEKTAGSKRAYWFLISSGFRTYRILPLLFQDFYPRFNTSTPTKEHELLDFIARQKFGSGYDASTGLVNLPSPQPLCDELASVPADKMQDRHTRFFLDRNPGHAGGDELACLTEITRSNLTAAGLRLLNRERRRALATC